MAWITHFYWYFYFNNNRLYWTLYWRCDVCTMKLRVIFFFLAYSKMHLEKHTQREKEHNFEWIQSQEIFFRVFTSHSFLFELCYALMHILLCMTLQLVFVCLHMHISLFEYKNRNIPPYFCEKKTLFNFELITNRCVYDAFI